MFRRSRVRRRNSLAEKQNDEDSLFKVTLMNNNVQNFELSGGFCSANFSPEQVQPA